MSTQQHHTEHAAHRLAITQFERYRRPWGRCGLTTWGEVLGWATSHAERSLEERDGPGFVPGYLTAVEHRTDLWRPQGANAYRKKENVRGNCILAIDQDDGTPLESLEPMLLPYEWVAYTTHRHTQEHPRFRVLLPLTKAVIGEKWSPFWAGAVNHFTRDALARVTADTQVKDAGRFYWWPAVVPGAERWVIHHPGALLDPDTIPRSTPWVLADCARHCTSGARDGGPGSWRDGLPIPSGSRDNTLRDIARYLRGLGWGEEAIFLEVRRINRAQCQPPYVGAEEEETCRRVARGAAQRFTPDDQSPPFTIDTTEIRD